MILPFVVGAQLSPVADMDVLGQIVQIVPKGILVVGRIELGVVNIQIEIRFGRFRSDSLECLIKEPKGFGDSVGPAAKQRFSDALTGIQGASDWLFNKFWIDFAGK